MKKKIIYVIRNIHQLANGSFQKWTLKNTFKACGKEIVYVHSLNRPSINLTNGSFQKWTLKNTFKACGNKIVYVHVVWIVHHLT